MARWQVEISGHRFDLEELPGWFTDPSFRVVEDAGAFFMEAAELEELEQSVDVHATAGPLVQRINGLARLRSSSFRAVELGAAIRELDDRGEQRRHAVVAVGTVEARAKVNAVLVKVGDTEPEPPAPGSQQTDAWMRAAIADADARDAIDLWSGAHDWSRLYKVFEIVRARADIVTASWASRAELSLFTRTANHQDAAGSGARHARSAQDPPSTPMQLHQAEALLERVLASWLDALG
ncbi:MAG: hypothetical protein ABI595_05285 [Actinomycetota bacterium]